MTNITTEHNYQRKSHRVDIPLLIDIQGKIYQTKDWSVSGVGIFELGIECEQEQLIDAKLILPMEGTSLTLAVTLKYRNKVNNVWGFEFHELDAKHKRLLRHYIEMAIEGRIENVEDLIAVASAPTVASPIEDALNLTDIEQDSLTKQFKVRSGLSVTIGVLFLISILVVLFYNTTYRVRNTGVVVGNTVSVTPNHSGIVEKVFISEGREVNAGDPLLTVYQPEYRVEKQGLIGRLQVLESQLQQLQQASTVEIDPQSSLITTLAQIERSQKTAYEAAQRMYQDQVITRKDLGYMEDRWRQSLANLQREQQNVSQSAQSSISLSQRQNAQLLFQLETEVMKVKQRLALIRFNEEHVVTAPQTGHIYNVTPTPGNFIRSDQVVTVIANDNKPFVVMSTSNEDMLKLKLNQVARIFVPEQDTEYTAKITSFGHQAIKGEYANSLEASLQNTLVKLEFVEDNVAIPPYTRVEIWIKTLDWAF